MAKKRVSAGSAQGSSPKRKRSGKSARAPKTAKEVLAVIDKFLASKSALKYLPGTFRTERSALWDVLTALRGPDNAIANVKLYTTAVIRSLALPRTAASDQTPAQFASSKVTVSDISDAALDDQSWHFATHVRSAKSALLALESQ